MQPAMRILLAAMAALVLAGCAGGYRGADAGALIYSSGSIGPESRFQLFYRTVGKSSGYGHDSIDYDTHSVFARPADFTGHENGQVTTVCLRPGRYEVYNYEVYVPVYDGGPLVFGPSKDFSIPFVIRPGEATYIGDFAHVSLADEVVPGIVFTAAGGFVVTDKHERDIPIARKQDPNLPQTVGMSVTDVSTLGVPTLLSREPQDEP